MIGPRSLIRALRERRSRSRQELADVAVVGGRPRKAVIVSSIKAPMKIRIGRGEPLPIYNVMLRIESGRRHFELPASRAVKMGVHPPQVGDEVVAILHPRRRKIIKMDWGNSETALSIAQARHKQLGFGAGFALPGQHLALELLSEPMTITVEKLQPG